MKILGVDTSSDICSVCLLEDNTVVKELHLNNGKTHSENLVPLFDLYSINTIHCIHRLNGSLLPQFYLTFFYNP